MSSEDGVAFYRNGRYRVEVDVRENGLVRFRLISGLNDYWDHVDGRAGHVTRWWAPWSWEDWSIPDAAKEAIRRADYAERRRQEAEFQTEMARNEVASIVEQAAALASLETELAR